MCVCVCDSGLGVDPGMVGRQTSRHIYLRNVHAGEEVGPLAAIRVGERAPQEAAEQLAPKDGQSQVGEHRLWVVGFWVVVICNGVLYGLREG